VGKRNRLELSPEYAERYDREVLDPFDLGAFVDELPGDFVAALLCVERDPGACHRSLVAARLRAAHGIAVAHLRPDRATPTGAGTALGAGGLSA
jgi:hypothetical protein